MIVVPDCPDSPQACMQEDPMMCRRRSSLLGMVYSSVLSPPPAQSPSRCSLAGHGATTQQQQQQAAAGATTTGTGAPALLQLSDALSGRKSSFANFMDTLLYDDIAALHMLDDQTPDLDYNSQEPADLHDGHAVDSECAHGYHDCCISSPAAKLGGSSTMDTAQDTPHAHATHPPHPTVPTQQQQHATVPHSPSPVPSPDTPDYDSCYGSTQSQRSSCSGASGDSLSYTDIFGGLGDCQDSAMPQKPDCAAATKTPATTAPSLSIVIPSTDLGLRIDPSTHEDFMIVRSASAGVGRLAAPGKRMPKTPSPAPHPHATASIAPPAMARQHSPGTSTAAVSPVTPSLVGIPEQPHPPAPTTTTTKKFKTEEEFHTVANARRTHTRNGSIGKAGKCGPTQKNIKQVPSRRKRDTAASTIVRALMPKAEKRGRRNKMLEEAVEGMEPESARLEKNRLSAKECRIRKKAYVQNLEKMVSEYEKREQAHLAEMQQLRDQIQQYQTV